MRHSTYYKIVIALALASASLDAIAANDIPLRKIKATKTGIEVNMLDSVVSDSYRKIYKYNEYGYITSVMTYHKDTKWTLDTSASYLQDYTFNDEGQCTQRTRYRVDENGNRTIIEDQGKLEVKDGLTWEYAYEHNDDGNLHPVNAKAYDKWGNLSITIKYETDFFTGTDYISYYKENRYDGPTYEGHYNSYEFKETYRTFSLLAKTSGLVKTMDPNELYVSYCQAKKWVKGEDGKLYCQNLYYGGDKNVTVGDVENRLSVERQYIYELNADGTRPLSETSRLYEWDDKGRLISNSYKESLDGNILCKETFTYADDYAKEMTAIEAIEAIHSSLGVYLYPEDKYSSFGRIATSTYVSSFENSFPEREDVTYTWNDNGQIVMMKLDESGMKYDDDDNTYKEHSDHSEEHYYYNDNGHASHMIKVCPDDDGNETFIKTEYVYDENGMWTGIKEYEGESIDGPWTFTYESHKSPARKIARKAAAFIDDMSEGSHDIDSDDGVFVTYGYYYVEDSSIQTGYLYQYTSDSARLPDNPELKYTVPAVPLDTEDESDTSSASTSQWSYNWDKDAQDWKLNYGPEVASHVYHNGEDIICDFYNIDKEKTGTMVYSFDDKNRLAKQSSDNYEITYEYLADGSDYLLEAVTTTDGIRSVQHYYYSSHKYVPTGIKSTENGAVDNIWYDMHGREIKMPTAHGIYIVNGKKVVK